MPNILDYLTWRGDLTFEQVPFSHVDALVLSRLAYIPFDGIVAKDFVQTPVELNKAAEICLALVNDKGSKRSFRMDADAELLNRLINSPRFSRLKLTGYVNELDEEQEEQFSALTVVLPHGLAVAYRGTDGTLVGWKEDFNMGFEDTVPAQLDAVAYLEAAAGAIDGPIQICGHSKGGNLAVYAAVCCSKEVQRRILGVHSNDGPGFNKQTIATDGFQRILERVRTYVPQSSIVGLLLEHEEDFTIVHSNSVGIFQHDVYSWEILGSGFVTVEALTNSSHFVDLTLKDWVVNMPREQREKMIDGIYSVLNASEGTTLRELWNGKNTVAVLKAWSEMDEETKATISYGAALLKAAAKKSLPALLEQVKESKTVKRGAALFGALLTDKPQQQ